MWRDSGTVGAEDVVEVSTFAAASAESAAEAAGAMRVEDAEQRVRVALRVAGDQLGVVEVVARVHVHAHRQAAAHGDLLVLVEQRDLDAVDLVGVGVDDADGSVHGRVEIARAPVAGQRRIEHVAQPMDDDRLLRLRQQAAVDVGVVVRRPWRRAPARGRHQDDAAADASMASNCSS